MTARAIATAALLALATGCTGGGTVSYDPDSDTSRYDEAPAVETFANGSREDFVEEATLPDGRKVRLWFSRNGSRLLEQHYSPREQAWTAPRVVFASTEPDPCQGIDIVEEGGIVAVVADFGVYCYDGEPPMESVAAVSTGDLTDWQVDITEGFDGWTSLTITDQQVSWRRSGESLAWTPDAGFSGGATFGK